MILSNLWDKTRELDQLQSIKKNVKAVELNSNDIPAPILGSLGFDGVLKKAPSTFMAYYMPTHNPLKTAVLAA